MLPVMLQLADFRVKGVWSVFTRNVNMNLSDSNLIILLPDTFLLGSFLLDLEENACSDKILSLKI